MPDRAALDKLSEARTRLLMKFKFFGYLAISLNLIESESAGGQGTACVDGKGNLYYNPKFINNLDVVEVMAVFCHEILHIVQGCQSRFPLGGNMMLWNVAADFIVNGMIRDSEASFAGKNVRKLMHETPLFKRIYPEEFYQLSKGKTTEQVYLFLLKEQEKLQGKGGGKEEGCGKPTEKGPGDRGPDTQRCDSRNRLGCSSGSRVQKELHESKVTAREWTEKIIAAAQKCEQDENTRGKMPGWLTDFITKITRPTITWKDFIRRNAQATFRGRYSWHRPARRSEAIGMRLQARKPTPKGAVVLIDSSGSVSDTTLNKFISECVGILRACGAPWIHMYFHDYECYFKDKFSIKSLSKLKVQRGGTSHIPVFQEVIKDKRDNGLIIAFTDLESAFPEPAERPKCPVIWAVPKRYENHRHPWGQKVVIDATD